jgi:hypothetical protein
MFARVIHSSLLENWLHFGAFEPQATTPNGSTVSPSPSMAKAATV